MTLSEYVQSQQALRAERAVQEMVMARALFDEDRRGKQQETLIMKITTDMIDNPIRFASCTLATRNGQTSTSYDYVVANWIGPLEPGDLVLGTPAKNVNPASPNLLRVERVYDERAIPAGSFFASNRVVDGGLIVAKVDGNHLMFWQSAVGAVAQSRLREGLEPAAKVIENARPRTVSDGVQLVEAPNDEEPQAAPPARSISSPALPRHPKGKRWTKHYGSGVPSAVRDLAPSAEITFVEFVGWRHPPVVWTASVIAISETRWTWPAGGVERGSIIAYTLDA